MGVACGAAHPPRGRAPVNAIRSLLDGLDPRVRFLVTSAVSFALIFVVVLVLFQESARAALGGAVELVLRLSRSTRWPMALAASS